jgi:hypothetical protein
LTGGARANSYPRQAETVSHRRNGAPHGANLAAGTLSGIAGLMVFLAVHALWIVPIWFVAPIGLVLAIAGGVAMAWALNELRPHLPARPLTAPAILILMTVVLTPPALLAEFRDPMFVVSPAGEAVPAMGVGRMATLFVLELMVMSAVVGAMIGWLLGRRRQAAIAMAVAGLVFALGPGHNLPFLGGTEGVWKGYALLLLPAVVAAVVLVEVTHWTGGARMASTLSGQTQASVQDS